MKRLDSDQCCRICDDLRHVFIPGDSSRDHFGMVSSRDLLERLSDLQRSGIKRSL